MPSNSAKNNPRTKLYLITGFLGAGKTTFIKQFLRLFPAQRVELIINEFGKEGVDGTLLRTYGAMMSEINGGSIFCACRLDQFEKVLSESAARCPDVIIVEASGLSDPTGVRRLFCQTDRFPHIDYQGAVCLMDAVRFPKLYKTARTCTKQLASSDIAVINRVDLATAEQLEETVSLLRGQRPDMRFLEATYGQIPDDFLAFFSQVQDTCEETMPKTADLTLRRLTVSISPEMTPYELQKFIEMFAEETFRVKGLIQTTEGLMLADCVGNVVSVTPYNDAPASKEAVGCLTILSGAGMPVYSSVKKAAAWYPSAVLSVSYE